MSDEKICQVSDILPNAGVAAIVDGEQVAVFRVANENGDGAEHFYAISNFDPFSGANVLSRGLVGSLKGEIVVASPIYKQHFCLATGQCQEDSGVRLKTWQVKIEGDDVLISHASAVAA